VNGKMIERYETKKLCRFLRKLKLIDWHISGLKVYLRVSSGRSLEAHGILTDFYNDGWYSNKVDFDQSLAAFLE
jgi:hypothetical protein